MFGFDASPYSSQVNKPRLQRKGPSETQLTEGEKKTPKQKLVKAAKAPTPVLVQRQETGGKKGSEKKQKMLSTLQPAGAKAEVVPDAGSPKGMVDQGDLPDPNKAGNPLTWIKNGQHYSLQSLDHEPGKSVWVNTGDYCGMEPKKMWTLASEVPQEKWVARNLPNGGKGWDLVPTEAPAGGNGDKKIKIFGPDAKLPRQSIREQVVSESSGSSGPLKQVLADLICFSFQGYKSFADHNMT